MVQHKMWGYVFVPPSHQHRRSSIEISPLKPYLIQSYDSRGFIIAHVFAMIHRLGFNEEGGFVRFIEILFS
jgi:hypothetical protein